MTALDRADEVPDRKNWAVRKLIALAFTLVSALGLGVATVALLLGPNLAYQVSHWLGLDEAWLTMWPLLRWCIAGVAIVSVCGAVYRLLPNLPLRRRRILPGALAATVLWLLASIGLDVYVHHFHAYAKTYGTLGAAVILLLWLYLSSLALLFGGELNAVLDRRQRARARGLPVDRPSWRGPSPRPA
jgi:membrane protein